MGHVACALHCCEPDKSDPSRPGWQKMEIGNAFDNGGRIDPWQKLGPPDYNVEDCGSCGLRRMQGCKQDDENGNRVVAETASTDIIILLASEDRSYRQRKKFGCP
eukprot:CAMPEP_0172889468 /NCGR_PEP_ID=MMETSP1075-20121228/138935_1 /TAXON_ID=2916 /ORGANISM="Ceratium fusus, Strain PA161109" /LENGTH=104 /DNA_ID=CAMNT_0013743529 /DNA_START=6 /DNA_END=320 /DNA_ORIENTATION=+